MTVVALMGDTHGNSVWAQARLTSLGMRGISTVFSLGDFGVWPGAGGAKFLRDVTKVSEKYGVEQVLVTVGNHDDHGRLESLWANPKRRDSDGRMLPLALTDRITVLPRGHRFQIDARTFVSLGGAASVDREWRTEGRDWWPGEAISEGDVQRTIEGGPVDVFLAHETVDPPWAAPAVESILANNPQGWPADALAYSAESRRKMTQAVLGVRPRVFAHGHMHAGGQRTVTLPGADYETKIWSLGRDGQADNLRLLDLDSLDEPAPVR